MTYIRKQLPVVLCVGDSISDTVFNASLYPSQLAKFLPCRQAISCGIAGNSTPDITSRLTAQGLKTYKWYNGPSDPSPVYNIGQIAFFLIGVNDLIFRQPLTAASLWSSIQSNIAGLQAYGMEVRPMTITPLGGRQPNTWSITGSTATGGTFTISHGSQTTTALQWNASAAQVQTAVAALSNVGAGNVTCTGGPQPTDITLTFAAGIATLAPALTASTTGGNAPRIASNWTPYLETVRASVNSSIRASGLRYVDLDRLSGGGSQPAYQAAYDSGDSTHPSALGAAQMAALAAAA